MRGRCWPGLLLVVAVSLADQSTIEACSCYSSGPACQVAWFADAIFSGGVRSIDVSKRFNGERQVLETVIRFDVEQRFLNVPSGPIEIVTDGLSTCSSRVTSGQVTPDR